MGSVPIRDTKRDNALIKDYKAGIGVTQLVAKYIISGSRIYQILNHYKVLKRSEHDRPKKPEK